MSHLLDYLCKSSAEPEDYGSFMDFQEDMKNLDLPLTLDNPELMSSEFFDSVLSMEQESFGLEGEFAGDPGAESPRSSESGDSLALGSESGGSLGSEETRPLGPEPVVYDPQPAKLVLQPNAKRVIFTKPMNAAAAVAGAKNNKGKQQVIRVQSISGNGRSLLLPVNVKNVKKIKIINANDLKMENIKVTGPGNASFLKKQQAQLEKIESTDEDEEPDHHPQDSRYPPLNLTAEEKRLLVKEGIKLPTHYPLTKNEEKELKRIRRKIRNKISAQDSRKRKKEYVDKLEEKAKRTTEENEFLKKRIKLLRKQNGRLLEQMRKLQAVLFSTTSTKATPTTCLMIVLFSTLLVCLPNLRPTEKREVGEGQLFAARRALLFNQKATEEDVGTDEFLVFNKDEDEEEPENATDDFSSFLTELARKYESLPREDRNCSEINNNDEDEFCRDHEIRNVFIEPDISDDEESSSIKEEPPSKKAKLEENYMDRKEK